MAPKGLPPLDGAERNPAPSPIFRVYAFGFAWMFMAIMPVIVPLILSRGLTMADVFSLQAVYGIAVMALELPTGYLCDVFGRKRTLLLGAALSALGHGIFAAAPDRTIFFVAELCLGAGWSLVSGADIALLYDLLDVEGADRAARRRVLANYQFAQVLGEATASLLGAGLAMISLDTAAWGNAVVTCAPFLIAATLLAPPRQRSRATVRSDLATVARAVFLTPYTRLIFLNTTVWGLSTFIAVWLLQPYWQAQGVSLGWFGLLWGGTLVTVGITAKLVPRIERRISPRTLMLVIGTAPVLAYAVMAGTGGALGIAGGFLFYVSRGVNAVFLKEAFNHEVPAHLRATCNSLASGTFRLVFSLCGPLIGILINRSGMTDALWILAAVFFVALLTLALPLALRIRTSDSNCRRS